MHVSIRTLAAGAAATAIALAGPAAVHAQDAAKPGTTGPSDASAETLQRMERQQPLIKAANIVDDAIDAELASKPTSGFTSLSLGKDTVILRYKGKPSPGVQAAVAKARATAAVEVLDAKLSKHQLEQAAEKVKVKLKSDNTPFTVLLPAEGDKVRVELNGDVKKTKDALPATSGVPVEVVSGDAIKPAYGRMSDTPPYYGGGRINNIRGGFCTAGFGVRTSSGREYILTAGHCGNPMHEFYNGDWTRSLGYLTSEENAADLALISTSAGGWIFDSWIGNNAVRDVVGWGRVYQNEWLCVAGSVTGANCDVYADTAVYSYCFNGECYSGLVRGKHATKTIVQPGDSGGPVFNLSGPNATQAQAKGIISGQSNGGRTVVFQDFETANAMWTGLTPK